MARITRVYTRSGDDGTTRLGAGEVAPKDSLRVDAYGTVDELNSLLGLARALGASAAVDSELTRLQDELFDLGARLAVPPRHREDVPLEPFRTSRVEALEALIDRIAGDLGPLENFILPTGTPAAAALHVARTVCRRAERLLVGLRREEGDEVEPELLSYLNRLSDALFMLARAENHARGMGETYWRGTEEREED